MRVNVLMIPKKELRCIDLKETLANAISIIDETKMLSLPVVDGEKFIGFLSKQFIYEAFFKEEKITKEEFLKKPVSDMMKDPVEACSVDTTIEEAATMFINSKVRFIPITEEDGTLVGIITQQAIFRFYQEIFGTKHNSVMILADGYKGAFARIADIIADAGGNICNLVQVDIGVMGLSELHISIDAPDFDAVIEALNKNKITIRNIIRR